MNHKIRTNNINDHFDTITYIRMLNFNVNCREKVIAFMKKAKNKLI